MNFRRTLLQGLTTRVRLLCSGGQFDRRVKRAGKRPTLLLESLEDRTVPALLTVTNLLDNVGNGDGLSLREAMLIANDNTGMTTYDGVSSMDVHDDIAFAGTLPHGTIRLGGTQLPRITSHLTITGPGSERLAIDAQGKSRIFEIAADTSVAISGLTITNGSATRGAGIANVGTLSVILSTLSHNSADFSGGIFNSSNATMKVTSSTLSHNSAQSRGGGIDSGGELTVADSVLTENSAGNLGGGIFSGGELTVVDSIFIMNSAESGGGVYCGAFTEVATVMGSTLRNNTALYNGGGIVNIGGLTVIGSNLIHNSAADSGGGIFNNAGTTGHATAILTGSIIHGNSSKQGGGISNGGTLTVTSSILSDNFAQFHGGGIYNSSNGTVTVTSSTLFDNSADLGGGIWSDGGTVTVTSSILSNNSAYYYGGGIYNFGTLMVTSSTLSENSASSGGGIFLDSGTAKVTSSTLANNSASSGGGGIYNSSNGTVTVTSSILSDNSAYIGGGIENNGGQLAVTSSTLSGNYAYIGGGIYNSSNGTLTVVSSTLSANSAGNLGGGIFIDGSTATVTASTLSANSASSGGGILILGGTLAVTSSTLFKNSADYGAGGITILGYGTADLTNSIVANSIGADLAGSFTGSNNLVEDGSGSGLTGTITGDPLLGPLADNGGPTLTHALLPDSPAINAGSNDRIPAGLTTDQRGLPRIFDGIVDIGAFELQNARPHVSDFTLVGDEDHTLDLSAADFTARFSDSDGDPLVAVRIESLPADGMLMLNDVAVSAGQVIPAAELDQLVFVPDLNFHGDATFSYTATAGIAGFALTLATVTLHVRSAVEQAADIAKRVDDLLEADVLNEGQSQSLTVKLDLQDNIGDIGKVQAFLNEVEALAGR